MAGIWYVSLTAKRNLMFGTSGYVHDAYYDAFYDTLGCRHCSSINMRGCIPGEDLLCNGNFKRFYNVVSDLFVWYHTYNRLCQTYSYPILIGFD